MSFLTYRQWDAIADAYIPLLALSCVFFLANNIWKKQFKLSARLALATMISIVYVYGWMYVDLALSLWPKLEWDYSTHTALAWALVISNVYLKKAMRAPVLISMGLYLGLMRYQNYHTWEDMISTTVVIAPFSYWLFKRLK